MASLATIYNMALARLGLSQVENINSPDEDSSTVAICNRIFPVVLRTVMAAHDWSFAAKSEQLALLGIDKASGMCRYQMPSDCVKIIRLEGNPHYTRRGAEILTAQERAALRYVGAIENPDLWPPTFLEAIVWRMAADLAISLSSDNNKYQQCWRNFQEFLYQAVAVDMNEQNPDLTLSNWMEAR